MAMPQDQLSLRQVEIIDAIARHRSISRAAEELNLTQSALSHAVSTIENQLGVTLFSRQKTGVEPTPFADPFRARAATIRAILADTKRELESQSKKIVKPLSIQCGFRAGARWVTRALAAVTAQIPEFQTEINFNMGSFQNNMESGAVDIGLAGPSQFNATNEFLVEPLGELKNQLFAPPHHPLTKHEAVTIDDLRKFPMVGNLIVPPHADVFEGNPGRLGVYDPITRTMQCAITINTIGGVIDVLRRTDGVARLPPPLVQEDVTAGYIVQLNDHLIAHIPINVHIIARKAALEREEVKLFIEALKNVEAKG